MGNHHAKASRTTTRCTAGSRGPVPAYTVPELAELLRVSQSVVLAMLETRGGAFFPGAWQEKESAGGMAWRVPERAVSGYLRRQMEPLFTYAEAADFLGVHVKTVQKAAAAWLAGDRNGFATVELVLPEAREKRVPRITLSELQRHVKPALRLPAA